MLESFDGCSPLPALSSPEAASPVPSPPGEAPRKRRPAAPYRRPPPLVSSEDGRSDSSSHGCGRTAGKGLDCIKRSKTATPEVSSFASWKEARATKAPIRYTYSRSTSFDSDASTALPSPHTRSVTPSGGRMSPPAAAVRRTASAMSRRLGKTSPCKQAAHAHAGHSFKQFHAEGVDATAGTQAIYSETRAIAGLPTEHGTVDITKDAETFAIKVSCKAEPPEASREAAHRFLSAKELDELSEWFFSRFGLRTLLEGGSAQCYAWLCSLVEIRLSEDGLSMQVHLQGYDDSMVKRFEPLRDDLRNMLDMQRDKIRSWHSFPGALRKKSDAFRAEISGAARLFDICVEKVDALHEYFLHACMASEGEGPIGKQEFRALLMNICRVGDKICIEEAHICRHWCELHNQAPHQKVGFARFMQFLVTKFPHIKEITAWQLRQFVRTRSHAFTPGTCEPRAIAAKSCVDDQWKRVR